MSYETDLWDSFETVGNHAREGKKLCLAYSKFIDELSKLNKEYASRLQKLCKVPEEDFGTLNTAWGSVKVEVENLAQAFFMLSEEMVFKAKSPVDLHVKETAKSRKKITDNGRKLIDSYTTSVKAVYDCKDSFEKAMKAQEITQGEYDQLSTHNELVNINKVTKKLAAEKKKSEGADKRYRKAVEKCTALEMKMYDTEMPHLLGQIEGLERQRIEVMKGSICALSAALRNVTPTICNLCDNIDQNAALVSADADVAQFCALKQTGKTKSERTVYEPFSSELQRCVRPGSEGAALTSSSSAAFSAPAAAPSSSSSSAGSVAAAGGAVAAGGVARSMTSSEVTRSAPALTPQQSMPSMSASSPSGGGAAQCRGLHDYSAINPSELSFKKGDIITILSKDKSGWWKGELNGRVGFFPSVEWVEELPQAAPAAVYTPAPQPQQVYEPPQQVYEPPQQTYEPQQSYEPAPAQLPIIGRCQALYDMPAQNENELTLTAGEMLSISTEVDGWYFGENAHGQQGMFPCNYVQLL